MCSYHDNRLPVSTVSAIQTVQGIEVTVTLPAFALCGGLEKRSWREDGTEHFIAAVSAFTDGRLEAERRSHHCLREACPLSAPRWVLLRKSVAAVMVLPLFEPRASGFLAYAVPFSLLLLHARLKSEASTSRAQLAQSACFILRHRLHLQSRTP